LAALPVDTVREWTLAAPKSLIKNIYGPTELTIACTAYRWEHASSPEEYEQGIVPIGEPFEGIESLIVDEQCAKREPGADGELVMGRPQLSLGYGQDEEKTRLAFVQIVKKLFKMRLTRCDHTREPQAFDESHLITYDRRQIICVLLSPESPLVRFSMDEYSRCSTALALYIILLHSFVFVRSGPFHGRSILGGEYMAI